MSSDTIPAKVGIFYASKKGTAKNVATQYGELFHAEVNNVDTLSPKTLKNYNVLIFVVANYGQGQPPPNSEEFFEILFEQKSQDFLKGIRFGVFGCGATKRAPYYQHFTKLLDEKLEQLGATRLAPIGQLDACSEDKSPIETWPMSFSL